MKALIALCCIPTGLTLMTVGTVMPWADVRPRLVVETASSKFHAVCSHESGGWCREFTTLEDARQAESSHRQATGHTDTGSSAGPCPF